MLQSFEAQTEHAKWNLDLNECRKRLTQVGSHQSRAGHAGHIVDATGKFQTVFATVWAGHLLQLLERFDGADNRAVLVVYRNSAEADRKFMSGFVVQKTDGFSGLRCLDGAGDRAVLFAEFTTRLITVQQSLRDTGVADDFMAQVARNALRPVAPEHNFLLHVQDAEAGRQAFEDAATEVGVVK
ncbi:MAG: hypothetical protein WAN76_02760 [Candidatus Sulfotelmatobacter sp.]